VEALGLGVLGCGLGSSQHAIVQADKRMAANLDGEESSFEFAGASRDENDICAFRRQLSGCAETHAFGCTGDEDCLQVLLVVLWWKGTDHETSHEETYFALDGEFVTAKQTHDEPADKKSHDRDSNVSKECRGGEIHGERGTAVLINL
jgi:hypothetical protein